MRHSYCLSILLLFSAVHAAAASSLDKLMIRRVIQQRHEAYQKCYVAALSWSPELTGRLVIRFTVERSGEVSSAAEQVTAGQRFPDDVVPLCVAEEFRQLRFPPGPEAFQVMYPLLFKQEPARR